MSSSKAVAAVAFIVFGLCLFIFRDQIGFLKGSSVTSDVEVDWSSCTVTGGNKGQPMKYLRCTEPTMVWMAVREMPGGVAAGTSEIRLKSNAVSLSQELFQEFQESHQLSADMTSTSEELTFAAERMLWGEVYAWELRKKDKFSSEVTGRGMSMVRYGDDACRILLCVSHTDSDTLCENAGVDVLYKGLDATLAP